MRPRHKAAENRREPRDGGRPPAEASMRPRHKAAENGGGPGRAGRDRLGFNEAAA